MTPPLGIILQEGSGTRLRRFPFKPKEKLSIKTKDGLVIEKL